MEHSFHLKILPVVEKPIQTLWYFKQSNIISKLKGLTQGKKK